MSLSKAGKQKMQLDKRARQLNDTIDAACTKRALAVLIENVVELMDLNEVHGMMTAADDKASRGADVAPVGVCEPAFVERVAGIHQGGGEIRM